MVQTMQIKTNFQQKIESSIGAVFRLQTVYAHFTRIVYIKYIWLWDIPELREISKTSPWPAGNTFDRGQPVSVSAHLAEAYTATLLVMVNVMKGGGRALGASI